MSKTVDELQKDFRKAFIEAKGSTLSAERAGIAAVVRALRDEMRVTVCEGTNVTEQCCGAGMQAEGATCCERPYYVVPIDDVLKLFNEILGDAGEKAAGVSVGNGETELDRTSGPAPATAPAPVKELAQWLRANGDSLQDAMGLKNVPFRLTSAADALEAMAGEVERWEKNHEALQDKFDSMRTCACQYDSSDAVCMAHSPALKAAEAERDRLKAALVGVIDFIASEEWQEAHTALEQIVNRIHKALGGDA